MEYSLISVISAAAVSCILLITFFNFFTIRQLKSSQSKQSQIIHAKVSILIPMRDEFENAQAVLETALKQINLADFEVIVRDDQSTDGTLEVLRQISDDHLSVQNGSSLPEGWIGKSYALAKLAEQASGDYLVFLDADVRLSDGAIAASISLLEELNLDYISPYPRQLVGDWLSGIVQPLLQWSWFATLPIRIAEKSRKPSTAVANGQFLIVKRSAYLKSGGHGSIKSEVIEDMELARNLRIHGFTGTVVEGSQIATCNMYKTFSELFFGYAKSQWRAFGSILGAVLVISVMVITSLIPLIAASMNDYLGIYGYLALVLSRIMVAFKTKSNYWSAIFHPIAILIWITIICTSIILKQMGLLKWRGRSI
jgi:glycosyltransferase involved in cell wall biosynthesis